MITLVEERLMAGFPFAPLNSLSAFLQFGEPHKEAVIPEAKSPWGKRGRPGVEQGAGERKGQW